MIIMINQIKLNKNNSFIHKKKTESTSNTYDKLLMKTISSSSDILCENNNNRLTISLFQYSRPLKQNQGG